MTTANLSNTANLPADSATPVLPLSADSTIISEDTTSEPKSSAKIKSNAKPKSDEDAQIALQSNPHLNSSYLEVISRCKLPVDKLKRFSDLDNLPKDTDDATKLDVGFGQKRAIKALQTALDIHASGYHVFAAGENGLGKRTIITKLLKDIAAQAQTPDDWGYVHNFEDARSPIALRLPAGEMPKLQDQVNQLWQNAKKRLSQRFRSEQYQSQIEAIKNDTHEKESLAYEELSAEGKQFDLALTFRAFDNKAMFVHPSELPESEDAAQPPSRSAKRTNKASAPKASEVDEPRHNFVQKNHMQKRLNQLTIELEQLEDAANDTIESLHRDIAKRTLAPLFNKVQKQFSAHPAVISYLKALMADMISHVERIVNADDEEFIAAVFAATPSRYAVNVLVSHEPKSGAPIVFEDMPTHFNLLGHVEQITQLGTVTTDVSMIRAGALHRANGGYLLLEASSLLEHPYAWQGLKRALQSGKIRLSSLEQMLTLTGSLSLAPSPIDLDIKVILLGEADVYYELLELEPEFDAVFKVRADFHDDVSRTPEHELALVAKMADIIRSANLLPFDNTAQAALLEHLSLQAEDQNRLSLHSDRLIKLLHESDRHARKQNDVQVSARHVESAIVDMEERSGYLRDLYWEELKGGQQLINTKGLAVGQVNALTVVSYADSEFGMPARLTAVIQPNTGSGDILDIERDVDLGGSLHAKGMLIMTSYLRALFSQHHELNFSASLAFEQSYAHIDGDSATVSEACALLSALADVPINQAFAITGSMNQLGEVQAVGGINAKIAGFFDACVEQGLTGDQGVIIPMANTKQLMLRDDIIAAVNAGKFQIFGVNTLSEALSLMTAIPIDSANKKGNFQKQSLFGKVLSRLTLWDDQQDEEDLPKKKKKKGKKKQKSAKKATKE